MTAGKVRRGIDWYLAHVSPVGRFVATVSILSAIAATAVAYMQIKDAGWELDKFGLKTGWWFWDTAKIMGWGMVPLILLLASSRFILAALCWAIGGMVIAYETDHYMALFLLGICAIVLGVMYGGVLQAKSDERKRERMAQAGHTDASNGDEAMRRMFKATAPAKRFADLAGMAEVKEHLLDAAKKAMAKGADSNGILLHGEPGNGKTVFAEALAGELGRKWIAISVADIVSRWVGQGPEQLKAAFASAEAQAPCVLFIDEADSVFAPRDGSSQMQDQVNQTNVFLTEVVRLRGKGVLVIAATNSLERLDAAAMREGRFDHKVEITAPDFEARLGLLRDGLKRHAPGAIVDDDVLKSVAKRWVGFSVARLIAITKQVGQHVASSKAKRVDFNQWIACLRRVQGRKDLVAEDTKSLRDLILSPGQRTALLGLAESMRAVHETEQLGGTLPNGVLFWGPPGTGKTETARALAKETGWAFIVANGHELNADPGAVDKLYRRAKDARPAIVFIDEADDVLGDRQYSAVRAVTNKLLTVMDGVGGRVPDLLFVAATNHPSTMDPAVLRGGRFSEKIEFAPPDDEGVQTFVTQWLSGKGWTLAEDAQPMVERLEGLSIASVASILQAAVNLAISRARAAGRPVERALDADTMATAVATVAPDFS